jgi:hypothetical protein
MTYSFRTNGNFIDFVHTDNTSLHVESVLKSLHNTSVCINWFLPEDEGLISFYVDNLRVENIAITEIDFDGDVMDSRGDFETGIEAMFPNLARDESLSYLVYAAVLTQSGEEAPVASIMQNTLSGPILWSRSGVGVYVGTLTGAFTANKTFFPQIPTAGYSVSPFSVSTMFDFGWTGGRQSDNTVTISFFNETYNSVEFDTIGVGQIFIEIRVYP